MKVGVEIGKLAYSCFEDIIFQIVAYIGGGGGQQIDS